MFAMHVEMSGGFIACLHKFYMLTDTIPQLFLISYVREGGFNILANMLKSKIINIFDYMGMLFGDSEIFNVAKWGINSMGVKFVTLKQ